MEIFKTKAKTISLLIIFMLCSVLIANLCFSWQSNLIYAHDMDVAEFLDGNSKITVENPAGQGNSTLFSGTSVEALGTVAGKPLNFNVYGKGEKDVDALSAITFVGNNGYVEEDLLLHLDSKNNTGTGYDPLAAVWVDLTGNGHDATLFGGAATTWSADKGLQTSGNKASYAKIESTNLKPQYVTMEWVGIDNTEVNTEVEYFSNFEYGGHGIFKQATNNIVGGGFHYGGKYNHTGGPVREIGRKLYIAITYDGNFIKSYIDGVLVGNQSLSGTINFNATAPYAIGADPTAAGITSGNALKGSTFAVRMYDRALTKEEIAQNYVADKDKYDIDPGTPSNTVIIGDSFNGVLQGALAEGLGYSYGGKDYTYKAPDGTKWVADYIEVNQKAGTVNLIRNFDETTGDLLATPTSTPISTLSGDGKKLLDMQTTEFSTYLSNEEGAWMDGIIGPVIDFNYSVNAGGYDGDLLPAGKTGTLSLFGLDNDISLTFASHENGSVSWFNGVNFIYSGIVSDYGTKISARTILLHSNVLKNLTESSGAYTINLDLAFAVGAPNNVTVSVVEGVSGTSEIGGNATDEITFFAGNTVAIKINFNTALYNFGAYSLFKGDGVTSAVVNTDYEINTAVDATSLMKIKVINDIVIKYTLAIKSYDVQILGKTTNGENVDFYGMILAGNFSSKVSHDEGGEGYLTSIPLSALKVAPDHFENESLYVFSHFLCNGKIITSSQLAIFTNELQLENNEKIDGKFTIFAVYQKKFIVKVDFQLPGESTRGANSYSVIAQTSPVYYDTYGYGIDGWAVNENETAIVEIEPDVRYTILLIQGNTNGQALPSSPNVLILTMNQSFGISVVLKHNEIEVGFFIDVFDYYPVGANHHEIVSSEYVTSNVVGVASSSTFISVDSHPEQTLTLEQLKLGLADFRVYRTSDVADIGLRIRNTRTGQYEILTSGYLNINAAVDGDGYDFFDKYVDANGKCKIVLFVVKQYVVNLNTKDFAYDNDQLMFSSELGWYTVSFDNGAYEYSEEGTFMVDFGTEITLNAFLETNGHCRFFGFNVDGIDVGESFTTYAFDIRDRTRVSAGFEKIVYTLNLTTSSTNGKLETTEISATIGTKISISFSPNGVYEVADWKMAGFTFDELKALCPDVKLSGGTLSFTATSLFLNELAFVGNQTEIDNNISTKLTGAFMGIMFGGGSALIVLVLIVTILILRSIKLKREKMEKEAEINNMKRKFNVSGEIAALRGKNSVPQTEDIRK